MSLINCPECNHEVSDQAATCPNCGYILKTEKTTNVTSVASLPAKKKKKLGCLFYCSIIILILMTITIVGAVLGNDTPSSNNNTNYGNQNAALSTNAPTSFAAKNINGLSNKQGEKIDKILSQCGLKRCFVDNRRVFIGFQVQRKKRVYSCNWQHKKCICFS